MGTFRVYFDIGWSSVVVRAGGGGEAVEKVWNALGEVNNGAVEGLSLGSYMVSAEHTLDLEEETPQGAPVPEFAAAT